MRATALRGPLDANPNKMTKLNLLILLRFVSLFIGSREAAGAARGFPVRKPIPTEVSPPNSLGLRPLAGRALAASAYVVEVRAARYIVTNLSLPLPYSRKELFRYARNPICFRLDCWFVLPYSSRIANLLVRRGLLFKLQRFTFAELFLGALRSHGFDLRTTCGPGSRLAGEARGAVPPRGGGSP